MKYSDITKEVSEELNIPIEVVELAYKSYWEFIREKIQELPIKRDIKEEEFNSLRTNFNIPSLGKLVCTFDRIKRMKERYKYIKNIRENAED